MQLDLWSKEKIPSYALLVERPYQTTKPGVHIVAGRTLRSSEIRLIYPVSVLLTLLIAAAADSTFFWTMSLDAIHTSKNSRLT